MSEENLSFYEETPPPPPTDDELAFEIAPFTPDPRQIRLHQTTRLHEIGEAMAKRALTGDIQAARAFVGISERIAKVVGLDAPKEITLDIHRKDPNNLRSYTTRELEQMLAEGTLIEGESTRD